MNARQWLFSGALLGGVLLGPTTARSAPPDQSRDLGVSTLGKDEPLLDAKARYLPPRGDLLLGMTFNGSPNSALVSVDPHTSAITQTHLLLNPREYFSGIAYDRNHHKIYVVTQWPHNLYAIDTRTLAFKHSGNLRIDDPPRGTFFDAGALAYDPFTNTLFTAISYREDPDTGPMWSDIARVDPATAAVTVVGRVDGALITSLAFNEDDRRLYGLALYGLLPSDSIQVLRIDPDTASTEILFSTWYRTMIGLAFKPPSTFFSWINANSHFYAETDLLTQTIAPLGSTDAVDTILAMIYEDFPIKAQASPLEETPVSFSYRGVVETVSDPDNVLGASIVPGDRFSGEFSYDAAAPYMPRNPNGRPPYGLSLSLGGVDYAIEGVNARVRNNDYNGTDHSITDVFIVEADTDNQITVEWTLQDPSTRALNRNDMLPKQIPLSKWPSNSFVVSIFDVDGHRLYTITGKVDRVKRQRARPGN